MNKRIIALFFLSLLWCTHVFSDTMKTASESPSWTIFRGDQRLSGTCDVHLPDVPHLLWSKKIGEQIQSSPVIAHGRIYIGSDNGKVYALSITNGETVWEFSSGDMIEASPLIIDHTLFIGSLGGTLYSLSCQDGTVQWKYPIGSRIAGSANWLPSPDGKAQWILVGSYDNSIYCVDSVSGKKVWSYKTENYINGTPSVYQGRVVFGGCDAQIHVLSGAEGKVIGTIDTGSYIAGSAACADNYAFVGNYGNKVMCIDVATHKIVWEYGNEREGSAFFSSPAINKDRVVIGCRDGFLYCINRKNGKRIWKFRSRGEIDSSPVLCTDRVVVGSHDGRVYMVRASDGKKVWSYEIGGAITSSPAIACGIIVISAEDGRVYTFGPPKEE
ncbi:MAG: PQQ-binding-like beta-propeller repeat protein [bacterium]